MKQILKGHQNMKKKLGLILLIGGMLFLGVGAVAYAQQTNLKDRIWLKQYVNLVDYEEGKVEVKAISNEKAVSFLNVDYQQTITDKINKLVKDNPYSVEEPLMILNPYSTNNGSLNVYFKSKEAAYLTYTISVKSGKYPDFTMTASNGSKETLTKKHAYQLIGLVPNEENQIKLTLYNSKNQVIGASSHTIEMPVNKSKAEISINIKAGKSKAKLTNGLYALFGHSSSFNANIFMYDNNGVLRNEIPVSNYRSDKLLFIDNCLVFSYDRNKIAKMNYLGQIVEKYAFPGYELHHDFVYDEKNNKILMLATELEQETAEDMILQLDLKTGKTTELMDFKDIMPEAYKKAIQPKDKELLDWIHFNSLQLVDGNALILSSRETSSIVKVEDIYTEPSLTYLLADKTMWEGTSYEGVAYEKVGDFTAQCGQHTVTYVEDKSLPKGQYYLHMYNNNLAFSGTMPDFDWSAYKGAGVHKKPTDSYYYRYLVDENAQTFELVKSFKVPYSSYVSSSQDVGSNHVICSGLAYNFGEYDSKGVLIRQFEFNKKTNTYRTLKYDFEDFYFNNLK